MAFLTNLLFTLAMAGNSLIVLLGLYAYLWRSEFLRGETSGPYWLLIFYDEAAPLLFRAGAAGLGLFFVLRLGGRFFKFKPGTGGQRLSAGLQLAVLLGAVSTIPACETEFRTLQTLDFNEERFHLAQQTHPNGVSYAVFRCEDSGGFNCQAAGAEPPFSVLFPPLPPTPEPLPTFAVEVEGETVWLEPRWPTPTPPADLLVQPLEVDGREEAQLALKIGEAWLGIEITGPTPTPAP